MFSLAQAAASGGKESLNDIAGNQKRPFVLPRGPLSAACRGRRLAPQEERLALEQAKALGEI
jgi:hypothetical protein